MIFTLELILLHLPAASSLQPLVRGCQNGVGSGDMSFEFLLFQNSPFNHFDSLCGLYRPKESNFRIKMVFSDCSNQKILKREGTSHRSSHMLESILWSKSGLFLFSTSSSAVKAVWKDSAVIYPTFCHMLPFWFPYAKLNHKPNKVYVVNFQKCASMCTSFQTRFEDISMMQYYRPPPKKNPPYPSSSSLFELWSSLKLTTASSTSWKVK